MTISIHGYRFHIEERGRGLQLSIIETESVTKKKGGPKFVEKKRVLLWARAPWTFNPEEDVIRYIALYTKRPVGAVREVYEREKSRQYEG